MKHILGVSNLWDFVLGKYTPIEYLESTGTQWIYTGYKLSPTSRREFKVYITGAPVGSLASMWGANSGSNEVMLGYQGGTTYYFMGKNGTLYISQNTIHEFDISTVSGAGYVKMDGSTVITSTGSSNNKKEYLFGGLGYADENIDVYHRERIYYYRIYDSEVLVRDFIPVRVGQIGFMYDKVSGKFFANQGSGSFTLGPDV